MKGFSLDYLILDENHCGTCKFALHVPFGGCQTFDIDCTERKLETMAITSASFNSPGTPDKHMMSSAAQGPSATGDYSDTSPNMPSSSSADQDALDIYGPTGDAVRMNRRAGLVAEALDATPNGISGATNTGPAFIDGDTANGFSSTDGVKPAGAVPTFPDGQSDNVISVPKAVVAKSNASNNPAVKGSPGFPGLP